MYYNRKTKKYEEGADAKSASLSFLYETTMGRTMLWLMIARPWFSKLISIYHNSLASRQAIQPFAEKYNIHISKDKLNKYKSFNQFFTRESSIDKSQKSGDILVSPADSKLSIFPISDDLVLNIKRSKYSVADILDDHLAAEAFKDGTCLVFRLSVDDYHRYHFIDNGEVLSNKKIKGMLHTVRPISEKYNVYTRNSREVTMMKTENFGHVAWVEVGALLVGKIINYGMKSFDKFEEKGMFEFGGSTIVILLNKEIEFDKDIVNAMNDGYEVKVRAGERIGVLKETRNA